MCDDVLRLSRDTRLRRFGTWWQQAVALRYLTERRRPLGAAAGIRASSPFVPVAMAVLTAACGARVERVPVLRFSAAEGAVLNEFYRRGPVAAHVVATPGRTPRVVVAFPAGNSGAAVWFDASGTLTWQREVSIEAAHRDSSHGSLRGVTTVLSAAGAPITIRQAIVSSVRVIRGYQDTGEVPPEVLTQPQVSAREIAWERSRLDGAAGYFLSLEVLTGAMAPSADKRAPITLTPDASGRLRLRITALSGDPPLTPFDESELLHTRAAPDARLRQMLAFLTYREKLLAGSWRFNTYFGRDTLMSLALLAPVLQPAVTEAGLVSVLDRLNANGEVAHEEDIGEFAVLRHMRAGEPISDAPILDYKMIDDDFMLPVVATHYLLETPSGRARAAAFLARRSESGDTYGARLARNLRFVVQAATPFSRAPTTPNLISLKSGEHVGNWRDSEDGLGGGRYPYDVNGVFVPAALAAIGRLHASGLLQPYLEGDDTPARAAAMAQVWLQEASRLFEIVVPADVARAAVRRHAQRVGVDPMPAVDAFGNDDERFRAVALDAAGRPIPILNSDEGFALLFLNPSADEVERIADVLTRPFPAGLMTDVGLVVANPAYAAAELAPRFDRNRYHGSVIWSWQQAMLAAGLERQLARGELTSTARAALSRARERLRTAIAAASLVRGTELWSWSIVDGRYRLEPFGQRERHETESNAAQLWSTVYLAQPDVTPR